MGHKKICLDCRLSFNQDFSYNSVLQGPCPQCGKPMRFLPHRFRPPRKADYKAWHLVRFLIENGFPFQHIYQVGKNELIKTRFDNYVPYPKTLPDAREFVEKHKDQKVKYIK